MSTRRGGFPLGQHHRQALLRVGPVAGQLAGDAHRGDRVLDLAARPLDAAEPLVKPRLARAVPRRIAGGALGMRLTLLPFTPMHSWNAVEIMHIPPARLA